MYCIQCGVRLQEGVKACPLCHTPLPEMIQKSQETGSNYSDLFPQEKRRGVYVLLTFITMLLTAAGLVCLILCLKSYGQVDWSGYVLSSLLFAWVLFVLPCWFRKWHPLIFIPVDVGAVCLFLLYICLKNGENWFLSFAFPVTLIYGALIIGATALFLYIKKGRLYILSGLFILIGGSCMLTEFFQHITFGTGMFVWSLYTVTVFTVLGLFFLLSAMIPPLGDFLRRHFFI